jgi:hypothetical protein
LPFFVDSNFSIHANLTACRNNWITNGNLRENKLVSSFGVCNTNFSIQLITYFIFLHFFV